MQALKQELENLLKTGNFPKEIVGQYSKRVRRGEFSIKESPKSHFCVYFAAFDPEMKEVFVGHHKKSGLWLFNGGHLDPDETIKVAVIREMREEWDLDGNDFEIKMPEFLTITEIHNPKKQPCRKHYDLWCFIEIDKKEFNPSEETLLEEFHEYGWKSFDEARRLMSGGNSVEAIDFVENKLCK